MTKILQKDKKWTFEKISLGFFSFAYGFMALSFVFFFLNKGVLQTLNKKEIQVNVVGVEPEETFISDTNYFNETISKNTTEDNPNIIDEKVRTEVLKKLGKKQSSNYLLTIDNDGALNNNNVQLEVGDSVTFINNSTLDLYILGIGGWGVKSLKPKETYTQDFFPIKKYEFTVKPFGSEGVIEVTVPLDTSN